MKQLTIMLTVTLITFTNIGSVAASQLAQPGNIEEAVSAGHGIVELVSLRSGLGVAFEPDTGFLNQLMDRVGAQPTEFLEDLLPTQAVFAEADPETGWLGAEPTITPGAQASLISAEVAAAKELFSSGPGAESTLEGMLYLASAKAQADFALVNMRNEADLFVSGSWIDGGFVLDDSPSPLAEQYAMLEALSSLATAVATEGPYASAYGDRGFVAWFQTGAVQTMDALIDFSPTNIGEIAAALRALEASGAISQNASSTQDLMDRLTDQLIDIDAETLIDRATLTDVLLRVAPDSLEARGLDLGATLLDQVKTPTEWHTKDLATAISALNNLSDRPAWERSEEAAQKLEELVDILLSSPELFDEVTGMVPAQIRRQGDEWHVADATFDTADVMLLARVLLNLAPSVLTPSPEAIDGHAIITIESTEFALTPATADLTPGEEITLRLENTGAIPHNIRLEGLEVFVEAEAGATGEVTFTVPTDSATIPFICDLPGHADGGMVGEFRVVADSVSFNEPADETGVLGAATQPVSDSAIFVQPLPPEDQRSIPFSWASIVLAAGFVIGMLVFTGGLLNFTKYAERQA